MKHQEQIHIVVVDNEIQAPKEQRKEIQQRYKKYNNISIIPIMENGGFSYANNIGYQYAKNEIYSQFIVVTNNDIEFVQTDFLELLYAAYRKDRAYVLSPDIMHRRTGEHQSPMDQKLRTFSEAKYTIRMNSFALKAYPIVYPIWELFNKRMMKKNLDLKLKNETYYQSVHKRIVPFGACLIFTPMFIEKEKKAFWPETRFYYEEYILALQCMRKKYSVEYNPSLRVIHESSEATKKSIKNQYQRTRFIMQNTLESCKVYLELLLDDGVENK